MKLSRKSWNNYVSMLSAINKTAGRKMQAWIEIHGTNDVEALVEYAYALTTKYGEAASATACQMYDEIAELQKANVPPAMPKPTQNIKYVDKAVRSTLDRAPSMVPSTVSEIVKRTGAETTLKNALRDGAYFAWVPNGDTCAFCITLASNGWRRASKRTINGDHAEHIHKNCDCEFAISFNGPGQIEGYDPDKYLKMYENAEGENWKDKVNSMRRANYAANKDVINAQKRAAYAARKVRDIVANGGGGGIINKRSVDFYAGVGNKVLEAKYADWIGDNQYETLMQQATGEEAKRYIRTAYRRTSIIGDGGTVDVRRFEKATGINLGRGGGTHQKKVEDLIRQINRSLAKSINDEERRYLLEELRKLQEVSD